MHPSMIPPAISTALVFLSFGLHAMANQAATPAANLKLKEGFSAELLYSVPKPVQGSWVAMCVDGKQRLIVSDQYGSLYRFKVPAAGQTLQEKNIEKIDLDIGGAQGLCWAFDSLYLTINTEAHGGRGLYRLRDTNGDDKLDEKVQLKKFEESGGEHGPHAVVAGPDGKSIYVICGNQTAVPSYQSCRVPESWAEDNLLPRIYGRGFMKGIMAPRGWIAKTDPDGKHWEIMATGFRNEYDAAFNKSGELFTYDADMEWDVNTPWYRPTRINHVVNGGEYGWRNGSVKWPAYTEDSLGAVVNVGFGSPTGVCFGYGAKFPQKYQDAFFALDWSYGKLYAVHMTPAGSSYRGELEEFISGQPLPLTDIVIHPDGAMYFTVGGRKVQSGLYRITYKGKESTAPVGPAPAETPEVQLRKKLESFQVAGADAKAALELAWPNLSNKDRNIRYAARVAVEKVPFDQWKDKALQEKQPLAAIDAMIAACRFGKGKITLDEVLAKLSTLSYKDLGNVERLAFLRAWQLAFLRLGDHPGSLSDTPKPGKTTPAAELTAGFIAHTKALAGGIRAKALSVLEPLFPAANADENRELALLLVYLQSPQAAAKLVAALNEAPTQEEQINYAVPLRLLQTGWTPALRESYFKWLFVRSAGYRGGANFQMFMNDVRKDAVDQLTAEEKTTLQPIIDTKPVAGAAPQFDTTPRAFVKDWKVADFNDVIHAGLEGGRSFDKGRKMFAAAACFGCHRFNEEGGAVGPDLTSVVGKYSPTDLLEHILDPSKEISDQYGAMVFVQKDGKQTVGRIMNLNDETINVNTNMLQPDDAVEKLKRSNIVEIKPSTVSMMPPGLLNMLNKDEILDLMAYLLSQGKKDNPMFK